MQFGLGVRGKALGGFFLEDWWMVNYTLGVEMRFKNYHSLGADYIFFEHFYQHEQYPDSLRHDYYEEYNEKRPRHALLLDYRFYILPKAWENGTVTPYINLLYKRGVARIFHVDGYEFNDDDAIVYQKEHFYDLGAGLGIHIGDGAGVDINAGVVKRYITENVVYYNQPPVNGQHRTQWLPLFRLNLYWYFYKHEGKKTRTQFSAE